MDVPSQTPTDAFEQFETVDPDGSVSAILDEEAETVRLPLDRYYMTAQEMAMVTQATNLRIAECMSESGLDYPPATADWQSAVEAPNRRYGLWGVSNAATYGYGFPPTPYNSSIDAIIAAQGTPDEAWLSASSACADSVGRPFPILAPSGSVSEETAFIELVDRGVGGGDAAAATDPEYAQFRHALSECLAQSGLVNGEGGTGWGPDAPADPEEERKVAVIDAQCHQSTGMVQGLFDLQAQYQAAYEVEHEAELASVKAEKDEILKDAKAYISEHG